MTDTALSAAPFVAALQPIAQAIVAAVVSGAITIGVALLSKWTGVTVRQSYVAALRRAAQDEAAKAVAAAADNLAKRQIDVRSPIVVSAAKAIANKLPAELKATGIGPEDVANMVAAEIGKLQASMTARSASPTS